MYKMSRCISSVNFFHPVGWKLNPIQKEGRQSAENLFIQHTMYLTDGQQH